MAALLLTSASRIRIIRRRYSALLAAVIHEVGIRVE